MKTYGVYAFGSIGYEEIKAKLQQRGILVVATEKDRGSYYMKARSVNGEIDCDKLVAEAKEMPGMYGFGISPAG